jgi:hypothetical protein
VDKSSAIRKTSGRMQSRHARLTSACHRIAEQKVRDRLGSFRWGRAGMTNLLDQTSLGNWIETLGSSGA